MCLFHNAPDMKIYTSIMFLRRKCTIQEFSLSLGQPNHCDSMFIENKFQRYLNNALNLKIELFGYFYS